MLGMLQRSCQRLAASCRKTRKTIAVAPILGMLACVAAASVSPSRADVLDIAPGGVLTVYSVPSVFTAEGVKPIARARPVTIKPDFTQHAASGAVDSILSEASARYAVRRDLLRAVAWRESHYHNEAVSPKGAVGVMQLMPETARELGVDRYDLSQNILGGAAYLKQMLDRYAGNEALALAAYNAGPGAVDRSGGIPRFTETQQYISAIIGSIDPIQNSFTFVRSIDR